MAAHRLGLEAAVHAERPRGVSSANLEGFRQEIDLYTQIRAYLPRLSDILKNINALTPAAHASSGYAEIVEAVIGRLES